MGKIQRNVWKVQHTTWRFLAKLHRSNFVIKILFLVSKVSNSNSCILQKPSFMKIIWHRISYTKIKKHFRTRLSTHQDGFQNPNKIYYRPNWTPLSPITIMNCTTHSPITSTIKSITKKHGTVQERTNRLVFISFLMKEFITYHICPVSPDVSLLIVKKRNKRFEDWKVEKKTTNVSVNNKTRIKIRAQKRRPRLVHGPVLGARVVRVPTLIWAPCPGTGTSSRGSTRVPNLNRITFSQAVEAPAVHIISFSVSCRTPNLSPISR